MFCKLLWIPPTAYTLRYFKVSKNCSNLNRRSRLAQLVGTSLSVPEVWDSISGPFRLDTVSPLRRFYGLCCPGAKPRRWAPSLVTRFGVKYREYKKDSILLDLHHSFTMHQYERISYIAHKINLYFFQRCWNPFCVWRRRPVIDDSNFFDVVIPSDEQKQGIPDDCPANTAYLTMREEVSFEVKIQKNPPTSNSREPFLNVNRREEKSQNAENSDAEFERRADFFTPPSGHANKIFSPLFGWKLYFTAVLIMTLLST